MRKTPFRAIEISDARQSSGVLIAITCRKTGKRRADDQEVTLAGPVDAETYALVSTLQKWLISSRPEALARLNRVKEFVAKL